MIFRLLLLFLVAVQFDGVATVLRFQVPAAIAPAFALWKEAALVCLVTLSVMATLRRGRLRLAAPRALIATWLLIIGMGCIEWLVCRAQGTAEPWQSLIALRRVYLPAMMFGIIVMPSWPLPPRWETRILHSLGLVTMIVVTTGWLQALHPAAWEMHPWIAKAADEGALAIREIQYVFRPFGTFGSPFMYGDFCTIMTMLALAYLLFHHRARLVYWAIFLVACAGVYISTIRTSILGAAVGAAYLLVVRLQPLRGINFRVVLAMLLVVGSMVAPFALTKFRKENVNTQGQSAYMASGSLASRQEFWQVSWDRLRTPTDFIFGLGTGAVGGTQQGKGDRVGVFAYNPVDNFYLLVMVNHGLLGVALWGALVAQLFWLLIRASALESEVVWLLHGTTAMLLMFIVSSLFHNMPARTPGAVTFWILSAVCAVRAHDLIERRKAKETQRETITGTSPSQTALRQKV